MRKCGQTTKAENRTSVVTQATLSVRAHRECSRVVRLAHLRGMATAAAYAEPKNNNATILIYVVDRPERMKAFLSELREVVPGTHISLKDQEVIYFSPSDSLPYGALRIRPFWGRGGRFAWIFAGIALWILCLLLWATL